MSDAFHRHLLVEARADGAALHELGEHLGALHGMMATARSADVDGLRQELLVLHDEFEVLHDQDMAQRLDQDAHRSWRARVKQLTARVDGVVGTATSDESRRLR
ncbi:MAG TPA: hypothetical protein VGJ60_09015 [Chloroflexota bacterium]|jgi:hypothetical protein